MSNRSSPFLNLLQTGTLVLLGACTSSCASQQPESAGPDAAATVPAATDDHELAATGSSAPNPPLGASAPSPNDSSSDATGVEPPSSASASHASDDNPSSTVPGDATSSSNPSDSTTPPGSPASGDTSAAGTGSATASDGVGGSGAAGAGGTANEPPPGQPLVQFVGRFDTSDPEAPRFAWSGSGIVATFTGSSLSVNLQDSGSNQFAVWIDGQIQPTLDAQAGAGQYPLASDLSAGAHTVELYRRTEANQGVSSFHGFDFGPDGSLLPPAQTRTRKLEVIGDSITCGYGNEGPNESCPFSPETENHNLSYAAVSARALDADLSTVAWSGKGIIYNYGEDTADPLPALYARAIPTEADSQWDFSFVPDAVVINLGTNDFSTDGDPAPELFRDSYAAFLEQIRSKYPQAFIVCTVGPMLGGSDLDAARAGIAAAVQLRNDAGDDLVEAWEMNISNDSPGCDWHPSVATHQAMADALVAKLRQTLDW